MPSYTSMNKLKVYNPSSKKIERHADPSPVPPPIHLKRDRQQTTKGSKSCIKYVYVREQNQVTAQIL